MNVEYNSNEKEKIVIIDYQLGNLFSVKQACDIVGMNAIISSKKDDIINANALVLPGVGAFKEAMNNLNNLDLIDSIKKSEIRNTTAWHMLRITITFL